MTMKNILKRYLDREIEIFELCYDEVNFEFTLFTVEDNYFGVIDYTSDEESFIYIPYHSISKISEKNNTLTVTLYDYYLLLNDLDNIRANLSKLKSRYFFETSKK